MNTYPDANVTSQNWLYDEGDDTTKAIYVAKYEELRSKIAPIAQRYFDKEEEKKEMYRAKQNENEAMRRAQENLNKNKNAPKQEKKQEQPEVEAMDIE